MGVDQLRPALYTFCLSVGRDGGFYDSSTESAGDSAISQNAIVANVPGVPPDVTFDVESPLDFNATSATISAWLATGGAFNVVENTPGTLAALMSPTTTA